MLYEWNSSMFTQCMWSQENISKAFYDLVKGVISDENDDDKKGKGISMFNPKTSLGTKRTEIFGFGGLGIFGRSTSPKASSPDNFKKILGYYNPQFRRFEAND